MKIPFNESYLTGKETEYIEDTLRRKDFSGDGYYTEKVTLLLENKFSLDKILMTTSCTHALEMAVILSDVKEGDEVIMPSFTFPSTANAVLKQRAKPVFAEIKEDTFNIDPSDIEKKITKKTKAIIPVHYAGVGCDMDNIMQLANKYNLTVIEDAAQGVNATYNDKYLGGIGDFGCYSFHGSKNYVCGEGGALVINDGGNITKNKAEVIREKGTNRSLFLKGEIDKYTWVDKGSSYLPSDLLMAVLFAQLQEMNEIMEIRKNTYHRYYNSLKKYLNETYLDNIFSVPENRKSNYHIFYLKFTENEIRDYVLNKLQNNGISATFHYIPLHISPMGKKLGYKKGDMKITENVGSTILRLPIYPDLSDKQIKYIIEKIEEIFEEL